MLFSALYYAELTVEYLTSYIRKLEVDYRMER